MRCLHDWEEKKWHFRQKPWLNVSINHGICILWACVTFQCLLFAQRITNSFFEILYHFILIDIVSFLHVIVAVIICYNIIYLPVQIKNFSCVNFYGEIWSHEGINRNDCGIFEHVNRQIFIVFMYAMYKVGLLGTLLLRRPNLNDEMYS